MAWTVQEIQGDPVALARAAEGRCPVCNEPADVEDDGLRCPNSKPHDLVWRVRDGQVTYDGTYAAKRSKKK